MKRFFVFIVVIFANLFLISIDNLQAFDLSDYNNQNFTRTENSITHTYTDLIYGRAVGYWWVGFFDRNGIVINSTTSSYVNMNATSGNYIAVYQCQSSYASCSFFGYSNWITDPIDHSSYDFGAEVNIDITDNYDPILMNPENYSIVSSQYTDYDFLSNYSALGVADWQDLVNLMNTEGILAVNSIFDSLPAMENCEISSHEASCVRVLNYGELTYGGNSRYYFACYNDGNTVDGFFVHSSLGNQVILGSWYGLNLKVLKVEESPVLHVSRSPECGGGVTITLPNTFQYECGINNSNDCTLETVPDDLATLEAQANSGYAFSHWEINNQTMIDTDGEINVVMSEDKEVVGVFKKTFTCTGGSFQNISGTGGWCVNYVNSETGINLSGNASEWWQTAINAGYATGSDPAISAIIVLDDSSLTYGHVGIITDFNETTIWVQDSNWSDPYDFQIRNHTLSRNRSDISGYIYCTPQN